MNTLKTKTVLVAIIGMFLATVSLGQTWEIGYMNMTFVDASRNNRQIETELFYPTDVSGYNVPLGSPITKRYPVIVFGHDQDISWNNYAHLWNKFATQGFIVAVPKTEMGPSMDVVEFAKDLAFIANEFKLMRYQPGSFFFDRHNSKSCFMGHGIGGSAATFAVQYHPLVNTLVSLAATETVPSSINAASFVSIPSLVIGGGLDCIAPIATNQMPMFDNIDSECKTFVNMIDATHCHFAQDAGLCANSQLVCPVSLNNWQFTVMNSNYLIISFLRYYMKSNAPALDKFEWKLINKQGVWTYIFACSESAPRIAAESEMENTTGMSLFPNPVAEGSVLNLSVSSEESTHGTLLITNLIGQVVSKQEITFDDEEQLLTLQTEFLKSGHYMVSVISAEGRMTKPLIVR
ncbi:MAG: T9SS type A sorting domain-containing protein [Bacteroidota bacterium]|nr:T9SS type A sorting domain-containing protein [Bacteroidota bacterium]